MRIIITYLLICAMTYCHIHDAEAATVSAPLTQVMHDLGYPYWPAEVRRTVTDLQVCQLAGYTSLTEDRHGTPYCIKWSDK